MCSLFQEGTPPGDSTGEQACHTEGDLPSLIWTWRSSQWELRRIQAWFPIVDSWSVLGIR